MDDESQIERLVVRERRYRDSSQWDLWRNTWIPENEGTMINISWYTGQIDEWIERTKTLASRGFVGTHFIAPLEVKFGPSHNSNSNDNKNDEDQNSNAKNNSSSKKKAVAISLGQISARFPYSGAQWDLNSSVHFVSRCVNVGGQWKMASFEAIYLSDSIVPALPNQEAAKDAVFDLEVEGGRGSYACMTWNAERLGFPVRRDLPGSDDPASVQRVMSAADAWLRE